MVLAEAVEAVIKANKRRLDAKKLQDRFGDSPDVIVEMSGAIFDLEKALKQLERVWRKHE